MQEAAGRALQMKGDSAVFSPGWVQKRLAGSQGETEEGARPVVVDEVDSDFLAAQVEGGALRLKSLLQELLLELLQLLLQVLL
jgi:hypothetical protein